MSAAGTASPRGTWSMKTSRSELLLDCPRHVRLASPDAEIVDRVCAVRDLFGSQVTVVARHTGMAFAARNVGLLGFRLPDVPNPRTPA